MKRKETKIKGCYFIEGNRYFDDRGFFQPLHSELELEDPLKCKQINWSVSKPNVVRGIHAAPFSKLVACVSGRIWDVVIDLRRDSETFYQWEAFDLHPDAAVQVLIPPGCGHGFFALTAASVIYAQDDIYGPNKEDSWHWRSLPINWPRAKNYILSVRDKQAPQWPG